MGLHHCIAILVALCVSTCAFQIMPPYYQQEMFVPEFRAFINAHRYVASQEMRAENVFNANELNDYTNSVKVLHARMSPNALNNIAKLLEKKNETGEYGQDRAAFLDSVHRAIISEIFPYWDEARTTEFVEELSIVYSGLSQRDIQIVNTRLQIYHYSLTNPDGGNPDVVLAKVSETEVSAKVDDLLSIHRKIALQEIRNRKGGFLTSTDPSDVEDYIKKVTMLYQSMSEEKLDAITKILQKNIDSGRFGEKPDVSIANAYKPVLQDRKLLEKLSFIYSGLSQSDSEAITQIVRSTIQGARSIWSFVTVPPGLLPGSGNPGGCGSCRPPRE